MLARQYDEMVKTEYLNEKDSNSVHQSVDLAACYRREGLELLAAGRPQEATNILSRLVWFYEELLDRTGITLMHLDSLELTMDGLKILADAAVQTSSAANIELAGKVKADAEETEAILAAYWEGAWEELRRQQWLRGVRRRP